MSFFIGSGNANDPIVISDEEAPAAAAAGAAEQFTDDDIWNEHVAYFKRYCSTLNVHDDDEETLNKETEITKLMEARWAETRLGQYIMKSFNDPKNNKSRANHDIWTYRANFLVTLALACSWHSIRQLAEKHQVEIHELKALLPQNMDFDKLFFPRNESDSDSDDGPAIKTWW
jgi:hypothetical protein